jgi:hypothetical protein
MPNNSNYVGVPEKGCEMRIAGTARRGAKLRGVNKFKHCWVRRGPSLLGRCSERWWSVGSREVSVSHHSCRNPVVGMEVTMHREYNELERRRDKRMFEKTPISTRGPEQPGMSEPCCSMMESMTISTILSHLRWTWSGYNDPRDPSMLSQNE